MLTVLFCHKTLSSLKKLHELSPAFRPNCLKYSMYLIDYYRSLPKTKPHWEFNVISPQPFTGPSDSTQPLLAKKVKTSKPDSLMGKLVSKPPSLMYLLLYISASDVWKSLVWTYLYQHSQRLENTQHSKPSRYALSLSKETPSILLNTFVSTLKVPSLMVKSLPSQPLNPPIKWSNWLWDSLPHLTLTRSTTSYVPFHKA